MQFSHFSIVLHPKGIKMIMYEGEENRKYSHLRSFSKQILFYHLIVSLRLKTVPLSTVLLFIYTSTVSWWLFEHNMQGYVCPSTPSPTSFTALQCFPRPCRAPCICCSVSRLDKKVGWERLIRKTQVPELGGKSWSKPTERSRICLRLRSLWFTLTAAPHQDLTCC